MLTPCPFTKLNADLPALLRQAHLYARGNNNDRGQYDRLLDLIHRNKLPAPTECQKLAHAQFKRRLDRLRSLHWFKLAGRHRSAFEWSRREDVPLIYRDPANLRQLARASNTGEKIAPHNYQLTDPAKLPDLGAYTRAITAAVESANGMILWGATGAGKSRSLYAAARIAAAGGETVEIVSPSEIKRAAAKAEAWDKLLERLVDADVVVIDDLSHARFSEAYAAALLELVEAATASGSTRLFVTVQCTGSALVRKWAGNNPELVDTAQAIARRLGEFLTPIEFNAASRTRCRGAA